jgi:hypothetical protein
MFYGFLVFIDQDKFVKQRMRLMEFKIYCSFKPF